jgi:hypothetical protein
MRGRTTVCVGVLAAKVGSSPDFRTRLRLFSWRERCSIVLRSLTPRGVPLGSSCLVGAGTRDHGIGACSHQQVCHGR